MGAHPVGEEHHLLLHPVLHFPSGAVALVVDLLCPTDDVGQDEAWVRAFLRVLGLGDHPARRFPSQRRMVEGSKESLLYSGPLKFLLGLLHQLGVGLLKPAVASQPDHVGGRPKGTS